MFSNLIAISYHCHTYRLMTYLHETDRQNVYIYMCVLDAVS